MIQEASQLATRPARDTGEYVDADPEPPHPPRIARRVVTLWLLLGAFRVGLRRVESERVGEAA